jgi:hypothetical protein
MMGIESRPARTAGNRGAIRAAMIAIATGNSRDANGFRGGHELVTTPNP